MDACPSHLSRFISPRTYTPATGEASSFATLGVQEGVSSWPEVSLVVLGPMPLKSLGYMNLAHEIWLGLPPTYQGPLTPLASIMQHLPSPSHLPLPWGHSQRPHLYGCEQGP